MAIGKASLVCPTCGEVFEITKRCYNRKEADSWEEWVKTTRRECPDCYKERRKMEMANESAEIIIALGLPEITEGTEKQIQYANNLRDRYLTEHRLGSWENNLKILKRRLANGTWQKFMEEQAEKEGSFPNTVQLEYLKHAGLDKIVVLATTNSARAVINLLKYDPFQNDLLEWVDNAVKTIENTVKSEVKANPDVLKEN